MGSLFLFYGDGKGKKKMREWKKKIGLALLFLVCTWCVMPQAKAQANVVIVLDPGHGGSEAGATRSWDGKTYKEEVINQKIANYCKPEL